MAAPISIFICYKKKLLIKRGGKAIEVPNSAAGLLHRILREAGGKYSPWRDDMGITAGMEWETTIYRSILASDVLLLLVGPGTSKSKWVPRELALASALGISIVPLATGMTEPQVQRELKELGIDRLQFKLTNNLKEGEEEALRAELRVVLEKAAEQTKLKQQETLKGLMERGNIPQPKAADQQRAATFGYPARGRRINLHVATGDFSGVRDIDVLVNSENDYMQMARFFESRTLSSKLRYLGASTRSGKYEDTIQWELDLQLQGRPRPFQPGEVFITSAGRPDSDLVRFNRARYVLHVAAVQAVIAQAKVVPFQQDQQIETCVRSCLGKLVELNSAKGVMSPPGTPQRAEQDQRAGNGTGTVHSILFPLFGAGQGGSVPAEVLGPMLAGFDRFFDDLDGESLPGSLTDIYISAYREQEAAEVIGSLRNRLPAGANAARSAN